MTTRREFFKISVAMGTSALLPATLFERVFASTQIPQIPLPGTSIPQFVEPLPLLGGSRATGALLTMCMLEFQQKILPDRLYARLKPPFNAGTYQWGYKVGTRRPSSPGCTIEAHRGTPVIIIYINALPHPSLSGLNPRFTIDQTIHWADPLMQMDTRSPFKGTVPTVTHLHGAEVSSLFDGSPEAWFTADGRHGRAYNTHASVASNAAAYSYPNTQPATALWFHDHTLGLTRINVLAGLAGFYIVRDRYDTGRLDNPLHLPASHQEIELMLQDRQFDTNGQLLFPDGAPAARPIGLNGSPPNPGVHPYWIPEFFGDTVVVNGKAWPYLDVQPRRYRFRVVNASNARFYRMRLQDSSSYAPGPAFWQIGTDGGLLDYPVKLNDPHNVSAPQLFLAPAERADIIIDFAGCMGRDFTLANSAVAPYPNGSAPDPATIGRIMQFRVRLPLSARDMTYNPASGAPLRGGIRQEAAIVRLVNPATGALAANVKLAARRMLVLIEVEGPGGPIEVLLNNTKWDGLHEGTRTPIAGSWPDKREQGIYLTELPRVGSTEEWDIINLTQDAHPIHLHLIQFQLINRQAIDSDAYRARYNALFPGGTYAGLKPDRTWGLVRYEPGVYIPGYGPPQPYTAPNADGALGGNPAITPFLQGAKILPDANEAGWKDTMKVFPGQVTRLVMRWAPILTPIDAVGPGENLYAFDPCIGPGYVWHCHILDHEDNEMMRPYALVL